MSSSYFEEFVRAVWDLSAFVIKGGCKELESNGFFTGFSLACDVIQSVGFTSPEGGTMTNILARAEFIQIADILDYHVDSYKYLAHEIVEYAGMPEFNVWLTLIGHFHEDNNLTSLDCYFSNRNVAAFCKHAGDMYKLFENIRKEGYSVPRTLEEFTLWMPCPKCPLYEGIAKHGFEKAMCFKCFHQWVPKCQIRFEDNSGVLAGCPDSKRCPKCHQGITKTAGCNHMTCDTCKHEFQWDTLEPYRLYWQRVPLRMNDEPNLNIFGTPPPHIPALNLRRPTNPQRRRSIDVSCQPSPARYLDHGFVRAGDTNPPSLITYPPGTIFTQTPPSGYPGLPSHIYAANVRPTIIFPPRYLQTIPHGLQYTFDGERFVPRNVDSPGVLDYKPDSWIPVTINSSGQFEVCDIRNEVGGTGAIRPAPVLMGPPVFLPQIDISENNQIQPLQITRQNSENIQIQPPQITRPNQLHQPQSTNFNDMKHREMNIRKLHNDNEMINTQKSPAIEISNCRSLENPRPVDIEIKPVLNPKPVDIEITPVRNPKPVDIDIIEPRDSESRPNSRVNLTLCSDSDTSCLRGSEPSLIDSDFDIPPGFGKPPSVIVPPDFGTPSDDIMHHCFEKQPLNSTPRGFGKRLTDQDEMKEVESCVSPTLNWYSQIQTQSANNAVSKEKYTYASHHDWI